MAMAKKIKSDIKRGEKITIILHPKKPDTQEPQEEAYVSVVDEVTKDGLLAMQLPTYKGQPLFTSRGDELTMHYFRFNGKFSAKFRVRDLYIENGIHILLVEIISEPVKEQNREYFRLDIKRSAKMYEIPDGEISQGFSMDDVLSIAEAVTADISATGARVRASHGAASKKYKKGTRFIVELFINGDGEPPMILGAEIVRAEPQISSTQMVYGLRFLEDKTKQEIIAKYLTMEQHRNLRWTRALMDED